jgi:hypothetical protein
MTKWQMEQSQMIHSFTEIEHFQKKTEHQRRADLRTMPHLFAVHCNGKFFSVSAVAVNEEPRWRLLEPI